MKTRRYDMENRTIKVEKQCYHCKKVKAISLTDNEYKKLIRYYESGGLIQKILPNILSPERELLRGGMCGECWINVFGILPESID